MILSLALVLIGIAVLVYSANVLVESSSDLALYWGVSLAVVGAIVVGFGTSLPELAVSLASAVRDDIDLATGNVLGSMVANLSLVLGGAVLISRSPISTGSRSLYLPLSLLSTVGFIYFIRGGISRWEGGVMLLLLLLSLSLMYKWGADDEAGLLSSVKEGDDPTTEKYNLSKELLKLIASLVGVIVASYAVTEGAIDLADRWGVKSGFIGISLIAVGTSLPELVASTVAAKKGKHALIIGTVLGSNVFNGFGIGGFIGVIAPGESKDGSIVGAFSTSLTLSAIALSAVFILSGRKIVRVEAGILLSAYIVWMILVGA
jgi:cation:H+ antiporter